MRVIRAHVERYLALYYDDATIASDEAFARWLHDLRALVPRGVDELIGAPVTLAGAATLLASLVYMASVDHEIVDSGVWDYQLWSDVQPARVARNGQRMPLDVYQRLVNANFILNVDRTRLMSDFSYLAVDQPGADAFLRFRRDLVELQDTMDRAPAACWRIEPRQLKANINY
jgi:arachidonate 15-lipoxygenase